MDVIGVCVVDEMSVGEALWFHVCVMKRALDGF